MTDLALGLTVNIAGNAVRFYKSGGWSIEVFAPYLLSGSLLYHEDDHKSYWTLDENSALDIDKMLENGVVGFVEGKKYYKDTVGLTDLEALKLRFIRVIY